MTSEAVDQIREQVRTRVAQLEAYAEEAGKRYYEASQTEQFINWDRTEVYFAFDRVAKRAPNKYIEKLMRKVFWETVRNLVKEESIGTR